LYLSPERLIPYQASTGCYWGKCAFCSVCKYDRTNYRKKSAKKVLDDLISIKNTVKYSRVLFTDYAIETHHFTEIVDEMDMRKDFKDTKWLCFIRFSPYYNNESIIAKAAKNGWGMMCTGIETFSNELSRFIVKGVNAKTIEENLKILKKYGIKNQVYMLVGLPTQSIDDIQKDMQELNRLEDLIDVVFVFKFELHRTTEMFNNPIKYNISYIDEEKKKFSHHKDVQEISFDEVAEFEMNEFRPFVDKVFNTGNKLIAFLRNDNK
jgi:radical SAM superfamily enzyme YgiQ (UPF0313 family)